ncbi:hypothetical protein PSE_0120 [Pseudovibrio sp. FO-BEG1]|nr:hypothetical protein PSE_0120 [Pseudovibrio sp. FO-BEG1]
MGAPPAGGKPVIGGAGGNGPDGPGIGGGNEPGRAEPAG